jgi:hypothetical protein
MSYLHDVFSFEKFNLKDMLGKLKEDPLRIPLGALDPLSTGVWNKILGKNWEPMVDQFGGAYGGNPVTIGDTGQGVYGRAQAAGVPTGPGSQMHDVAHVLAGMLAGGYGASQIPGMGSAGGLPNPFGGQQPQASQDQSKQYIQMLLARALRGQQSNGV